MRFWVSLDCGQAHDYSAALVSERVANGKNYQLPQEIHVGGISRAPLRTPYPKIAEAVVSKCAELEPVGAFGERADIGLIIDAGGVGRAVRDLVREEISAQAENLPRIHFWPVAATSGSRVNISGGFINVAKRDLIAAAVVALQDGRLKIGEVENADLLRQELAEYRVKLTKRGNETFEGAGRNDDLTYALALACWAWSHTREDKNVPDKARSRDPFEESLSNRGYAY